MVGPLLSDVPWGPIDALTDHNFVEKWIEPAGVKRCLSPQIWVVTGEKGSGKSAIRKAITEIHRENAYAISEVDFQDVPFIGLHQNIVQLTRLATLSKTAVLSNYWQYSIITEMVKACAEVDPNVYGPLLRSVPKRRRSTPMSDRLIELLEEAWNKIDLLTGASSSSITEQRRANLVASGGLTAKVVQDLSRFPLDESFLTLRRQFFSLLNSRKEKVVLVLDGLDRLKLDEIPADAVGLIFASLADAILNVRIYKDIPDTFQIKAFIPHDRYLSLNLRDSDKLEDMHSAIKWDSDALQEFIARRVSLSTKQSGLTFQSYWKQIFPEQIMNSRHNMLEDSFQYLLRHTMYRPRHLQIHLINLANDNVGRAVDPSSVPRSISASSKTIAKAFLDEYSVDYPWLHGLAQSFHMRNNIMEYREFRDSVHKFLSSKRRALHAAKKIDIEEVIDALYAMGFFGVLQYIEPGEERSGMFYPPTRQNRRHVVEFYYKNPKVSIHGMLQETSLVALHPIFIDFVGLRSVPDIIVG